MAPVLQALQQHPGRARSVVCVTAQHREMLDQVLRLFAIVPDVDLDLMEANQTLASLTSAAMTGLTEVLQRIRPDLVLVQGDTSTAMVAALAAFYQKVRVGHIEAGLRTHDRYSPFPEEVNRQIISVLSTLHFAPTATAADALRREGVPVSAIHVTGNTVIDALLWVVRQPPSTGTSALLQDLGVHPEADTVPPIILVTAHRRENFGPPLERICLALLRIAERNPQVQIVYPVHMNPNVREPVQRILGESERIHLLDPLPYEAFAQVMKHAYLVLTDSGGIQEEAPALGKPVLVMRTETERPEGVEADSVRLVGTETESIVAETESLLHDAEHYRRMAKAVSLYGDGQAAGRVVDIILKQKS